MKVTAWRLMPTVPSWSRLVETLQKRHVQWKDGIAQSEVQNVLQRIHNAAPSPDSGRGEELGSTSRGGFKRPQA